MSYQYIMYTLIAPNGIYQSKKAGALGGHSKHKIYGKLDCRSALAALKRRKYVKYRVFFANEKMAIQCGYRPCAVCMPKEYKAWKLSNASLDLNR